MPRYHTRPFDDDMFKSLILSSINHPFHMDTGHIDKMGGFSIDYQTYYVVMELLGLTKPRKVLELGYGYSTILLQQYSIASEAIHHVVENDRDWIVFFDKLNNFRFMGTVFMKDIEFRSVLGFENVRTYAKFKESLDKDYDFVLVDGPNGSNGISRPDIMEHPEVLSKDAVVIVHDTDRIAEKTMVDRLTDIIHPKTVLQFNRCTVVSMLTDISGLNRLNEGQPKT